MPDAPKPEDNVATPDAMAQIEGLKSRVALAEGTAQEATRRATNATLAAETATEAATRAIETAESLTATSRVSDLDRANSEMNSAKAAYKEAFTAGDADAAAEAQAKMARLGSRLERLETEKESGGDKRPGGEGRATARPAAATADPVEQFLSTRTAPTAAWLRQHPEFFRDNKFNAKVRAADLEWESDGHAKDTPEYFNFIERKTGLVTDQPPARTDDDPPPARAKPGTPTGTGTEGTAADLTAAGDLPPGRRTPPAPGRPRAGAPVAAPPTRDGAPALSGRGGDAGVKRITPEMQRWAEMMYPGGIDPEAYYDEYKRLVDEGEINDRFGR